VQLLCLDASLQLQQAWISALVSRFALREADLPRQLQAEWRAALEVVPQEVRVCVCVLVCARTRLHAHHAVLLFS